MSKNKAVTTKPRTGGNEKLLFHFVGWKGGKWIPTNSNGFQREHDLDPQQGLKQRWCFPASGMEPDCSGRWDREVMVVSKGKEKHGMQWSRGLALSHTDYDSVLGKSPVGTGSSASQWETKCPAWRAMVLLFCPPQRGKPGVALAKITKGKEGGIGSGRETEWKLLDVLCILYWYLHTGQQPVKTWVCSHEANCWPKLMPLGVPAHSLLTVNRLERSTSFPLPSPPAPCALPALPPWNWKTITLLGDTTSCGLCP